VTKKKIGVTKEYTQTTSPNVTPIIAQKLNEGLKYEMRI